MASGDALQMVSEHAEDYDSAEDDEDDEDEYTDDERVPPHPVGKAFKALVDELKDEGLTYFMLDEPPIIVAEELKAPVDQDVTGITRAVILATDHMLLRGEAGPLADELLKNMRRVNNHWEGGDTSKGNCLLLEHILPALKLAQAALKANKHGKALGCMLGLTFFGLEDVGYIHDNEVHLEPRFKSFFTGFASTWTKVLACSDEQLGIFNCRPALLRLLEKYEPELNEALTDYGFSVKLPKPASAGGSAGKRPRE